MASNLYEAPFTDDVDFGMLAINELYGQLNVDIMSNYVSLSEYQNSLPKDDKNILNFMQFNIRNLETNFIQLETLLSTLPKPPDILALTETWLNEENKDSYSIEGYNIYREVGKLREHGGVSLCVRNDLVCE